MLSLIIDLAAEHGSLSTSLEGKSTCTSNTSLRSYALIHPLHLELETADSYNLSCFFLFFKTVSVQVI